MITVDDLVVTLNSNSPQENTPISVTSVTDDGSTVTSGLSYQWLVNGTDATGSGATTATYTPAESDEGKILSVNVTYTDASEPGGSENISSTAGSVSGIAATPIIAATSSAASTTENVATVLSGLSVQPGDASASDAADSFTATLYVDHGKLGVGFGAFTVTVGGGDGHDSGDALTITGSLADVNAALAAVTYTAANEFEGTDTVHFTALSTEEASVGGNVSADATPITATITVNPVAEAPSAVAPTTLTLSEDVSNVAVSGVSVGPLAEDGDDSVSALLTVANGTLHVDNSALPADVTVSTTAAAR